MAVPKEGLPRLALPTPAALSRVTQTTSPAPQQLPFPEALAAIPLFPLLSLGSNKSLSNSPRSLWHTHLLPVRAGATETRTRPAAGGCAFPQFHQKAPSSQDLLIY